MLSLLGHHVETAHDSSQAPALLQAMQPGVALLYIGLADMKGFEPA